MSPPETNAISPRSGEIAGSEKDGNAGTASVPDPCPAPVCSVAPSAAASEITQIPVQRNLKVSMVPPNMTDPDDSLSTRGHGNTRKDTNPIPRPRAHRPRSMRLRPHTASPRLAIFMNDPGCPAKRAKSLARVSHQISERGGADGHGYKARDRRVPHAYLIVRRGARPGAMQ